VIGSPVEERRGLGCAGNDACHAIRTRLMGEGFFGHHLLIGAYRLTASVVDGEILDSVVEPH
jgi:hypothetical protein